MRYNQTMIMRLFAALACCLLLSGCILDRLWETHRQFYAKEPKILVKRESKGNTRFVFQQPTLLETDVAWLVGEKPTEIEIKAEERLARYRLVQEGRPKSTPLEFQLCYVKRGETYRLAEASLPKVGEMVLTPEFLAAAIETLRRPNPDLLKRQVKLDLHSFKNVRLPKRKEIEKTLGSPNRGDLEQGSVTYRYFLVRPDGSLPDASRAITAELFYDPTGAIQRAKGSYLRYKVNADLIEAEAVVQIQ